MAGEVQNSALVHLLNICVKLKVKCLETATSQSTLTLAATLKNIPFNWNILFGYDNYIIFPFDS